MRCIQYLLSGLFCIVVLLSLKSPSPPSIGFAATVAYFKTQSQEFASSALRLQAALSAIDKNKPKTILHARTALRACRLNYKRIEFFMEYFFKSNARFYNGPPKYEIEEPYMEWQTPIGLQVIEGLLFDDDVISKKKELIDQADALASSAQDIGSLLFNFKADDKQILESFRLQLIRVYTLGITGFDAPLLKSGIEEAATSVEALKLCLIPYLDQKAGYSDSVASCINSCIQLLGKSKGFNSFDRLTFLTQSALPLQRYLGLFIKEIHLEMNSTGNILNYDAPHLFSPDALNIQAFPSSDVRVTPALIALGSKLFNDKQLSGNNQISCATCHQPQKHFTDALPKSIAFDGHSTVKRNAASLLYAGFQHGQFWDGRAKDLEAQIRDVLINPTEMNYDTLTGINKVRFADEYKKDFANALGREPGDNITVNDIATSIAAFLRTLNPRNSPFDQYMQGKTNAITAAQMRGFNLFMGKGQCGTCHFAPVFNGLVPPLYDLTELEVLGTPGTDNFDKPKLDKDKGRFNVFPIAFYEQAFKTPTVRNVSATAPYMHNGAFKTLEKVVDFYNRGGGNGLGLHLQNQTLSSTPLKLSKVEIADIVSFMHSLRDSIVTH